MVKIKAKSAPLSSDSNVEAPVFHFSEFRPNVPLSNDGRVIDFVTDGKSLYVCAVNGFVTRATIEETSMAGGLLKIVSQGDRGKDGRPGLDGAAGAVPEIGAEYFDLGGEKKLALTVGGKRKAMTGDLTPPVYVPVVDDKENPRYLSWEWTNNDPPVVDLMKLRPLHERPILLRTNSDNTKREAESNGPANFIQWKYEGDEYWTNLISIQELMNLAFAGMATWEASDGKWHFGYKEVLKATYDSNKSGRRIINRVELGDILFDAGELPFEDKSGELQLQIDLITVELANLKAGLVKSVSVDGGLPNTPDSNGNVNLPLNLDQYAKKSEIPEVPEAVDAYTKAQSDAKYQPKGNYVKGVKVGADGEVNTPDNNGVVTITLGDLDLTDYVKKEDLATINGAILYNGGNITINGGSVSGLQDIGFRINSGELQYRKQTNDSWGSYIKIMDISAVSGGEHVVLSIHDGKLWISYNNGAEEEVGSIGGGSGTDPDAFTGVTLVNNVLTFTRRSGQNPVSITLPSGGSTSGMTESEVKHLIGQILEGILDSAIPEYVRTSGHNYFVRINELNTRLSDYYTKTQIDNMLAGYDPSDPGPITVISYRTFTVYTWYSVDANPATPALPTSASWDGTSNGLTLTGNTNNWTDHPGNRPNDSTRLWLATITLQSDGTASSDWVGPIDLTAYPGKDGNGVEFIYTLCVNKSEYNALVTPVAQHNDNRDDDYPTHWTDKPQGIGTYSASDNIETFHTFTGNEQVLFRIEAASIRTSRNGQWSAYCAPFIWSMWGEDGLDGDGLEYIFFLADDNDVTVSNDVYSLKSNLWPDNSWAYEYQDPNSGWTDDPTGINVNNKYEFVSKRKFHVDSVTRQGAWSNWSEPALWSIWKQGDPGPEGNAVTVTDQQRYYKASDLSTGVTAPNINADPTLAANGSWQTTSNSMQLDENNPYLWFFERITYSNGNKWQSTPVVIRYFNSAVNVDYQEIQENVLEAIGGDLEALDERLSKIVDTNGDVIVDGQNGLVSILTNYTDNSTQKSFADLVVDAKEATIKNWAGSAVADGLGRQSLTTVKNELDGIDGKITTAATQARQGAVNDARTEWSAADATITNTATKATYVWEDEDGVIHEYTDADVTANVSSKTVGNKTYTRKLVAEAMSAIKQESDKVSIIVGQNGNVKADIIVEAINETTGGSTVQIDADHIILNGDAVANAITAKYANVGGGAVVLDANGLQATGANIEGTITATAGTFGGNNGVKITQNGVTLGSDCSISWDSIDPNTIPAGGSDVNAQLVTKINQWSIESDTIIANNLKAKNIDAEYLTVDGQPISASNSLNISFGLSSLPENPDPNTIYFLY